MRQEFEDKSEGSHVKTGKFYKFTTAKSMLCVVKKKIQTSDPGKWIDVIVASVSFTGSLSWIK